MNGMPDPGAPGLTLAEARALKPGDRLFAYGNQRGASTPWVSVIVHHISERPTVFVLPVEENVRDRWGADPVPFDRDDLTWPIGETS